MEPEEYPDGQLNGRLRWVRDYAGPNSGITDVVFDTNGLPVNIQVNAALRNSKIIDSNGDGTKNGDQGYCGPLPQPPFCQPPFNAAVLNVGTIGNGTVTPDYRAQLLLVGQQYQITAQPADGFQFNGWTGSITSASPQIQFVMTNGLTYIAHFSFMLAPGSYNGLFYEDPPATIEFQRSGAITVTTVGNGKCSGSLQMGAAKYSFSGQLTTNGTLNVTITKSTLKLNLQVGNDQITGTVGDGTNWTASIRADRAVFSGKTAIAPAAGTYTMVLDGSGDPNKAQVPLGDGFATVTVDAAGRVKMSGALADGTKVSQASAVSADGLWPFFVPLYRGTGQIIGWLTFENTGNQDISGVVDWIKQANAKAVFYPGGFTNFQSEIVGSSYVSTNKPVTGFTLGNVAMTGGNLAQDIVSPISVNNLNQVTDLGTNHFKIALDVKNGFFKGTVPNPQTGRAITINGAILQKQFTSSGFFLGTNQSGEVILGP